MNIIDFAHLDVAYEDKIILHDICLSIAKGQHSAILGANGSGKSTLLKLFSNDIYPRYSDTMKKEIFEKSVWDIWELKKNLGIITNDLHYEFSQRAGFLNGFEVVLSGFYSSFHIYEHQEFPASYIKKANEILHFLDIEHLHHKPLCEMSTGEVRKCIIARALVHDPKAMILDEPTVGLDIKAQREFLQTLQKISKKCTIILITHHLEEIFQEISHIILLKQGRIIKQGEKKALLNDENLSFVFNMPLHVSCKHGRYSIESVH